MKSLQIPLVGFLTTLLLSTAAFGESTQELMTNAQAAYLRGDIATAKQTFQTVLRVEPKNQTAIGYLRMITAQEKKNPIVNMQQKELEKLIVPKVEFKDATLGSTLDFLKTTASKLSEGKVAVNFVVQVPEEQVKTQTVTLSLTNVPMSEALRYLGEVANVSFAYEKFAIVVKPRTATTASAQK